MGAFWLYLLQMAYGPNNGTYSTSSSGVQSFVAGYKYCIHLMRILSVSDYWVIQVGMRSLVCFLNKVDVVDDPVQLQLVEMEIRGILTYLCCLSDFSTSSACFCKTNMNVLSYKQLLQSCLTSMDFLGMKSQLFVGRLCMLYKREMER